MVHHMMMDVVHYVMVHTPPTPAGHGLGRNRFCAIGSRLGVGRRLLSASCRGLRRSRRLLRRIGGGLRALRGGGSLLRSLLRALRRILAGASGEQRERQCSPGKSDEFRSSC